jgi:hypothetical protein
MFAKTNTPTFFKFIFKNSLNCLPSTIIIGEPLIYIVIFLNSYYSVYQYITIIEAHILESADKGWYYFKKDFILGVTSFMLLDFDGICYYLLNNKIQLAILFSKSVVL